MPINENDWDFVSKNLFILLKSIKAFGYYPGLTDTQTAIFVIAKIEDIAQLSNLKANFNPAWSHEFI